MIDLGHTCGTVFLQQPRHVVPMRIWENELGSKSPRMLNLKHFLENKSV
jgi:hypothetical protein